MDLSYIQRIKRSFKLEVWVEKEGPTIKSAIEKTTLAIVWRGELE